MTSSRQLFVNLPVADLDTSASFFTALGWEFDARFTDENATCLVLSEQASVMLLRRDFFDSFHRRGVVERGGPLETLLAVSAESREDVDRICELALAAGATASGEATDQGFMYARSFADPDSHVWEVIWMDPAAMSGED